MSRTGIAALILLGCVLGLSVGPSATTAEALVPTHDVGDKVGLGATTDIEALADPYITLLNLIDDQDDNFTINEITVTGSSDI